MLENVLPSNERHLARGIQSVMDSSAQRVAVVGLAFKPDTDDLRESPSVPLIEYLLGKGRDVRVYDPHIRIEGIYGSNKSYIMNALPHIGKLLSADVDGVIEWAEVLVVASTPDKAVVAKIRAAGKTVIDLGGTNLF